MMYLIFLFWASLVSSFDQQNYDFSECSSNTRNPGSTYTCNNISHSCKAFLLYRANHRFRSISNISALFGSETDQTLSLNNRTFDYHQVLELGYEVLVPIKCSCSEESTYESDVRFFPYQRFPVSEIACGVFQGLVKPFSLTEENPSKEETLGTGSEVVVPIKCACPSSNYSYFLTYPFKSGDNIEKLAAKFRVSPGDIWEVNGLHYKSTIFPNTTALVPLKEEPVIITINSSEPSGPGVSGFSPTNTMEGKSTAERMKIRKFYIAGSVAGILLIVFGSVSCGLYVKALNKLNAEKNIDSYGTTMSSPTSCLSPDLLVGIKYSLHEYTVEEMRRATNSFSKIDPECKIYDRRSFYKGSINGTDQVMIQRLRSNEACRVIHAHSWINHVNVLSLLGVCHGVDWEKPVNISESFLVFESPRNGSLRDCLARQGTSLSWQSRKRIAFDIATGLHYLHHCVVPSYDDVIVKSTDVFITEDWRAKLGNIAVNISKGSQKVGIFAFGVVLLELISGKTVDDNDGRTHLRDSIELLEGGGCFERLGEFIDPNLKDEYEPVEAMCFVVLAKACIEDVILQRPSMDDIIKVLARLD